MKCEAKKKNGEPCGMRPSKGSKFCMNHGGASSSSTSSSGTTSSEGSGSAIAGVAVGLALAAAAAFALWKLVQLPAPKSNVRELRPAAAAA